MTPNLDYDRVRLSFGWGDIHSELDWLPGGSLNAAHEAVDRHADGPNADKVALHWVGENGEREDYTFAQLKEQTNKAANVLRSLGIGKGDRVFSYMDRLPEHYIAMLGALKVGAVTGPISPTLDPGAVRDRLIDAETKVVVTQPELRRKITHVLPYLTELQHILVVNKLDRDPEPLDMQDLGWEEEMEKAPVNFEVTSTGQYDVATLHYTVGPDGRPAGVAHPHEAVVQQYATGKWVLDLGPDEVYWSTAGPGSMTDTVFGMLAPWTNGATQIIVEGGFKPVKLYELVHSHRITVLNTIPGDLDTQMSEPEELSLNFDISSLRHLTGVGCFSAEAVAWCGRVFGMPLRSAWMQDETGAPVCADYPSAEVRPGSVGRPLPGVELAVVDDDFDEVKANIEGSLVVRPGWPSMFHAYWNDDERYVSKFRKGWYVTGERARLDDDGYVWLSRDG